MHQIMAAWVSQAHQGQFRPCLRDSSVGITLMIVIQMIERSQIGYPNSQLSSLRSKECRKTVPLSSRKTWFSLENQKLSGFSRLLFEFKEK